MIKILISICLLALAGESFALPAFPGAEGMGAAAVGGRGGSVCIVDTLSDSAGDGQTFRECVESSGSRYVVFEVSGVIDLLTDLYVNNPYITIAGQTSPGGVAIVGKMLKVQTHDVIVTHMRFRPGHHRSTSPETERGVEINGCGYPGGIPACSGLTSTVISYNIIFDHCSFSWGADSVVEIHSNVQDTTFSWCHVTHPLQSAGHPDGANHNLGFFVWGKNGNGTPANPTATISLHHSFIGYSRFRVPENNYNSFLDSVNNVVYYWDAGYTHQVESATGRATANIIGTYRKINSSVSTPGTTSALIMEYETNVQPNIYVYGAIDGNRTSQSDEDQWSTQEYWMVDQPLSVDWKRETVWPTTGYSGLGIAVQATVMTEEYADYVVANAGATKPARDGVDSTAISGYMASTGGYTNANSVDTIEEITTLVDISGAPDPPADTDNDGMADSWETSTFGDLDEIATGDYDSDGYDNIEEYLHYLTGYVDPAQAALIGSPSGSFTIH